MIGPCFYNTATWTNREPITVNTVIRASNLIGPNIHPRGNPGFSLDRAVDSFCVSMDAGVLTRLCVASFTVCVFLFQYLVVLLHVHSYLHIYCDFL